jgi:3-deoxy-D-manno-octulosonate 8-phosphate phosphatase (KDO 8-P phosphatase)
MNVAENKTLNLFQRAANIKLVVLDVDGVLTPGTIVYDSADCESKFFNVKDGLGISLGVRSGLKFAIITARNSPIVERRAQELGIHYVVQGMRTKLPGFQQLAEKCGFSFSEMAYVGDDLPDLAAMQEAGLACCPADAALSIQAIAHLKAHSNGGEGALREILEFILESKSVMESKN